MSFHKNKGIKADNAHTRRGRIFLSILGGFSLLVGLYLMFGPDAPREYVAAGCCAFGVALAGVAAFGSDRVVNILQGLVTGWP